MKELERKILEKLKEEYLKNDFQVDNFYKNFLDENFPMLEREKIGIKISKEQRVKHGVGKILEKFVDKGLIYNLKFEKDSRSDEIILIHGEVEFNEE